MALAAVSIPALHPGEQIPLIHIVDVGELELMKSSEAVWYEVLSELDCRPLYRLAAEYYEALYRFNLEAKQQRARREQQSQSSSGESKGEARQRLLLERLTGGNSDAEVLHEPPVVPELKELRPEEMGPGRIPLRFAGRQPKCFFSLYKS